MLVLREGSQEGFFFSEHVCGFGGERERAPSLSCAPSRRARSWPSLVQAAATTTHARPEPPRGLPSPAPPAPLSHGTPHTRPRAGKRRDSLRPMQEKRDGARGLTDYWGLRGSRRAQPRRERERKSSIAGRHKQQRLGLPTPPPVRSCLPSSAGVAAHIGSFGFPSSNLGRAGSDDAA